MLEEARRSSAMRSSKVTGPHMLSFAERAAMCACQTVASTPSLALYCSFEIYHGYGLAAETAAGISLPSLAGSLPTVEQHKPCLAAGAIVTVLHARL